MSNFFLQFILISIFCHNLECKLFSQINDREIITEENYACFNLEKLKKAWKIKPHEFQNQDIFLINDKNYALSESIGAQMKCLLQTIKSYAKNVAINHFILKKSLFTKRHCEKLFKIIGKPLNNRTYIIVSGAPYVCKKHTIIGNYIYFSANPIPAPLIKFSEKVSNTRDNVYSDSSLKGLSAIIAPNLTANNMVINSNDSFYDINLNNKLKVINCNIYDNLKVNDRDRKMYYEKIHKYLVKAGNKKNVMYKYRLNYDVNNDGQLYNYDSQQQCACSYTHSNILYCKLLETNNLFYLNISEFLNLRYNESYQYPNKFNVVWDKIKNVKNITFDEYKIQKYFQIDFNYDYDKYINVYLSTEKANLNFFLKIESINKPLIIQEDFFNFVRMFKFYTSNANSGFTKFKKIRKNYGELDFGHDDIINTTDVFTITFVCFIFIALIPSITLFFRQRTSGWKEFIEIEDIDLSLIH